MEINKNHLLYTNYEGKTFLKGNPISSDIGKKGIVKNKNEGDGATPVGVFQLLEVYYRPDRVSKPKTLLPVAQIEPNMGWCDDPSHQLYNQLIRKPFTARHEDLWLERHVYNIVVITSHNQNPIQPHKGSAVFIHLRGEKGYTEGCLALGKEDLLNVLEQYEEGDAWCVGGEIR